MSDDMELWGGEESPRVTLLRKRYKDSGLMGWDDQRVSRLCRMLKITVYDLCAMAGEFRRSVVKSHWARQEWPVPLTLHFARYEAVFFKQPLVDDITAAQLINEVSSDPHHD